MRVAGSIAVIAMMFAVSACGSAASVTESPTVTPTLTPSLASLPTPAPTAFPTLLPTPAPTAVPTPSPTPNCPTLAAWTIPGPLVAVSAAKANAALAATKQATPVGTGITGPCPDPLTAGPRSRTLPSGLVHTLPSTCTARVSAGTDEYQAKALACATIVAAEWHAYAVTRDPAYLKAALAVLNEARTDPDPVWQDFEHLQGAQPFLGLYFQLADYGLAYCADLYASKCSSPKMPGG
jgi:hypothetical protein